MILVIPSFEIYNGKCTSIVKGVSGSEKIYCDLAEDVVGFCGLLRRENAKSIHIIDRNSIEGEGDNFDLIVKASSSLDIAFQLTADFQNIEQCIDLLDRGIYRLILNDLVFKDPENVKQLIKKYTSSNFAFSCQSDNGTVQSLNRQLAINDFFQMVKELGANRIVYSNKIWSKEREPDYSEIIELYDKYKLRSTLNDSIYSSEQLLNLNQYKKFGIDSVIIGQALFDNVFPCQNIWREIECELEK